MLIQFILYLILFYVLFRVIRFFIRYLNEPDSSSKFKKSSRPFRRDREEKINREDIIEADFEEINDRDKEKEE